MSTERWRKGVDEDGYIIHLIPPPGTRVRITTMYPNHVVTRNEEYNVHVVEGVVQHAEKHFKETQFAVKDTATNTSRWYDIRNVAVLELLGKAEVSARSERGVPVDNGKGTIYYVDVTAPSCTCPGFQFRRKCRHLDQVRANAA